MLPSANRGAGQNLAFPDVCNTVVGPATAPIPYPNMAMNAQATGFSPIVKVSMMNALNMLSSIPMTMGDEAGTAHPTIKGAGRYTMGNPIVKVNFIPGINLTCPATGNNMNAPAGACIVPSITTVFYTYASSLARELACENNRDPVAIDGAICIGMFEFATPSRVLRAIHSRKKAGCKEIHLDLRNNPGGRFDSCLRLLDMLLPQSTTLCLVRCNDGDTSYHLARSETCLNIPLVVHINERTASAAELFAAVLKFHGRARIVGRRSYGKTSMERFVSVDGSAPEYGTLAHWFLPDGQSVENKGVTATT